MITRLMPWLLLAAAWWPARITGAFDGAPFDTAADAVILGLVLPLLLWLAPGAFRGRRAHVVILALVAWKAFGSFALVQDGWCTRVEPSRAYVRDGTGAAKSWDARTDWLAADPRCTAITTAPYLVDEEFPVWFFNLPSAAIGEPPSAEDVPPQAVTRLSMRGTLLAPAPGTLRVRASESVAVEMTVDGRPVSAGVAPLSAGAHEIVIAASLTGTGWTLAPLWNDADVFAALPATVAPPSALDRAVRPWGAWVPVALVGMLVLSGIASLWQEHPDWRFAAWVGVSVAVGAAVATWMPPRRWHYTMLALVAATRVPMPESLRNVRGAFMLLAPLWLGLHVVDTYYDLGFNRMQLLMPGNDWWQFQRYAYRIFMQGYWLEGGEHAFWFQPLYRWIAGALHMLFGQSQTGENYWDAVAILIMALFSFEVVRQLRGFRWGIFAGALMLTTYLSGPGHVFIGRGLSEISSAGFICLSALFVMSAREARAPRLLIVAGAFGVLGVWTRLNNLPMAVAVAFFAWPLATGAETIWKPRQWLRDAWRPAVIALPVALAIGMGLFAARTWYYTGVFSVFHGTQGGARAVWQPGMSPGEAASAAISSVMMVATTTDPPRFHNGALPILAGAALAVLAFIGAPFVRRLPLALVLFTLAGFSSALLARGSAYSGRFSVHVVAATVAVLTLAIAALYYRFRRGTNLVRP